MPRTFAYVRVSTTGQTTENQIQEIEAAGFQVEPRRIVTETVSGSTAIAQRRGFSRLMDKLESGDILIVTKLDRLGRDAIDVSTTVRTLAEMGVRVYCLALGGADLTGRHHDHECAQCRRPIRAGFADRADAIRSQARQVGRQDPRPTLHAQR